MLLAMVIGLINDKYLAGDDITIMRKIRAHFWNTNHGRWKKEVTVLDAKQILKAVRSFENRKGIKNG